MYLCTDMFLGMHWRVTSGASRMIVSMLWIFFIIVIAIYTGNLVAFLAVPRITAPIDTVQQLTTQTQYKIGIVRGQALHQVLEVNRRTEIIQQL